MKIEKICPKCNSTDIILVRGYTGPYGTGNNIQTGFTILSNVQVDRYICGYCGYSEEWIRKEDIEKVRNSKHATK